MFDCEIQTTTASLAFGVTRQMADVLESATGRRVSRYAYYMSDLVEVLKRTTETMRRNMNTRMFP